jgi:hypothetical protein
MNVAPPRDLESDVVFHRVQTETLASCTRQHNTNCQLLLLATENRQSTPVALRRHPRCCVCVCSVPGYVHRLKHET